MEFEQMRKNEQIIHCMQHCNGVFNELTGELVESLDMTYEEQQNSPEWVSVLLSRFPVYTWSGRYLGYFKDNFFHMKCSYQNFPEA